VLRSSDARASSSYGSRKPYRGLPSLRHSEEDRFARDSPLGWWYDQDPRLEAPARIAVVYAGKFGIVVMRWLPMRNAKRESTISLLIKCDASGDAEQIRETVNTSRLHARVEHNPNFGGGVRDC
jgi:hypothetical protein